MSTQINMDINKLNANHLSERRVEQAREEIKDKKADNEARADASATTEQVQLSERARSLQAEADRPAFDEARVDAIRNAIAEGRYHVDPERLAERFVALEQQLG